jgi:hypothetical protein
MRVAAKIATAIMSRYFKRRIYKNIKANVVCMSNCCRRTILRRPFIQAHLGLQHIKALARMRSFRQRLVDLRDACQCCRGPLLCFLYKRLRDAIKKISNVVKRSGVRQALCASRHLALVFQARARARAAYVDYYVPLTMAKRLQRVVRRQRAQADHRRILHARLQLHPFLRSLHDRFNYDRMKQALSVICSVRRFREQRISYVKCRCVCVALTCQSLSIM